MFWKLQVSSVLTVLEATEAFFLASTICVLSRCRLSKSLHLSKFSDLFELFQKKHLKVGTMSMLKIVCSSVLLAAVLTTFVLSILKWGRFLALPSQVSGVAGSTGTSVGSRGLIHLCHCVYSL